MKKLMPLILGAVLLSTTVACSKPNDSNTTATGQRPANGTSQTNNASNQVVVVPAGVTLDTSLEQDLSTGKNHDNERFILKVKNASSGQNKILKDAQIQGHLENVVKAARGKKASLRLVFDQIVLKDGSVEPIDVTLINTQIETKTKGKFLQNAGIILGGTVAGHFLGDKAKFKHGSLAGGAAATAYVLSSPGGEVVLKRGTNIKLKLKTPLQT